jgi:fibronectin-binding autotransporter adhesin
VADWRTGLARSAWRSLISIGACLLIGTLAWSAPAGAQDASWLATPTVAGPLAGTFDFNANANWNPATAPGSLTNTGTATFGTTNGANVVFSAAITTLGGLTFNPGASAYTFTLSNPNQVILNGAGIVGAATFNSNDGFLEFLNASTAGSATINSNDGVTFFRTTSTAGSATINSNDGGTVFFDNSTPGNARLINGSGVFDFSASTGPNNDKKLSAGSIEGAGDFFLGANQLTVGGNNVSTTVSGFISDCGFGANCQAANIFPTPLPSTGGSLVKTGSGTLTLSGFNTYTGGTTVNAGLINFKSAANFGTGQITLNGGGLQWATGTSTDISSRLAAIGSNGGTFDTNGSNVTFGTALTGSGSITKTGLGTLTFSVANNYSGATLVNGGTLQGGAANVFAAASSTTINNGGTLDLGGFAQTINSVSLAGGTLQHGSLTGAVGSTGGAINGLGGTASLTATAGTTTLSGTNSYTGATTVNGGTLFGGVANAFATASSTTINNGGTLDLGGFSQTINSVSLAGGTLQHGSLTGAVSSTSGVINGLGGTASLTATAGATILTGTNNYTGATAVNGGTLFGGTANAFSAASTTTINNISTLDLGGHAQTINNVFLSGGLLQNGNLTGAVSSSGGGIDAFSGTASLTTTAGTTMLVGANGYTGATNVNGGTLLGGTANAFATNSTTTINSGGTLDLGGLAQTINGVSLAGGTLQHGSLTGAVSSTGGAVNGLGGAAGLTTMGGTTTLLGNNIYTGATAVNGGTLLGVAANAFATNSVTTINGGGTLDLGGFTQTINSVSLAGGTLQHGSLTGAVSSTGGAVNGLGGAAGLTATAGTTILTGTNSYTGGTAVNGGLINFNSAASFGTGPIALNGGSLQWASGTGSDISSRLAAIGSNGGSFDTNGNNVTFGTALTGGGSVTKTGLGTLTFSVANNYAGGTVVNGGTLVGSAANVFAATSSTTINSGGTLDLGGVAQAINNVALAGGTLQNGSLTGAVNSSGGAINGLGGAASLTTMSGTTILTGTNSYTGATTVNGGVLDVAGNITGTSQIVVNSGGMLTGTGTIDPLTITINSGSIFAPGNGMPGTSTNIIGSLALASGALYVVQVDPAIASFATVSGTATLGGASVNAIFANGSYVAKQYTILTAGGISGTFNPSVVNTNLPAGFKTSLSYDSTHAFLDLALVFSTPGGLNRNQQAVGNALSGYFATQGSVPTVFGALTSPGLTQISGATATGSQQTTFNAMGLFLGTMTDPFVEGRAGAGSTGATAFAAVSANAANNPASATLAAESVQAREPRWSVWGAVFGGSQSTDGNASVGSNNTTSNVAGTAVGADYLISPDTLVGFALAGGGTGFSVANGGTGRSDLFQAGAYARQSLGAAYLSAALAYGWQDISTNRTVAVAGLDQLRAQFNANAFAGRAEAGNRFVVPFSDSLGITPYAAAQFTVFDLPRYAEQAIVGASNFALAYGAKDVNDSRSELGFRTDQSWALADGTLTLRGRFAWAHDFSPDRSIAATFQSLPGASFVVDGAAQAANSALATASFETKWKSGWSAAVTFEGEFSAVTQSYAGKAAVRYQW